MTGCCVPNCKNRSEQGFRLFPIPRGKRNLEKNKAWIKFVNRGELLPLSASVCEVHFDKHQFECGRADNRKLLKWNAVPTIAVHENQSPPQKRTLIDTCNHSKNEAGPSTEGAEHVGGTFSENADDFVQNQQFQQVKNKLKNALRKISSLEKQIKNMEERCKDIFNEDQLKFLRNGSHRGEEWSDHTINKGLKLYMACGANGYEELRQQGLPYPSIRTLQHRIQISKFDTGVIEDVSNLFHIKVTSLKPEEKHTALLSNLVGSPTVKSGNQENAETLATHALAGRDLKVEASSV